MADIKLMDLPECTSTKSDDYLLLDQDGTTKKVSYDTLMNMIRTEIRNACEEVNNNIPIKATTSQAQTGTDDVNFITSLTALKNFQSNIISGTYTGDGTRSREISLGFEPRAIFVSSSSGVKMFANSRTDFGFAITGYNVSSVSSAGITTWSDSYSAIGVTNSGFKVNYISSNDVNTNGSGNIYYYIAIK